MQKARLIFEELPEPPIGKTGWPWSSTFVEVEPWVKGFVQPVDLAEDGREWLETEEQDSDWPKISVVTPSFNQGEFIEETIRSVLLQGYPNLEFFVVDGGSDDGTVSVLQKYDAWITRWVSEPDKGQSDAINKGWAWANGEFLAYLNSDDIYLPGALRQIGLAVRGNRSAVAVIGGVVRLSKHSKLSREPRKPILPGNGPMDLSTISPRKWFLPQQSGFIRTSVFDKVGRFAREELHYTMDREIYYRVLAEGPFLLIDTPLATFRYHEDSKSGSKILEMYREDRVAISMIEAEGVMGKVRQWLVANARGGQGHWKYANAAFVKESDRVWHALVAAVFSPRYGLSKKFWKLITRGVRGFRR